MGPDEYDALIADPDAYFRRALLPRFGSAFAPLAKLAPFSDMTEAASMPSTTSSPSPTRLWSKGRAEAGRSRARVPRLDAGDGGGGCRRGGSSRAYQPEVGGAAKAPYDVLADTLRGTKGIMIDRFRQPEKILAAAERFVPLMIDLGVRQAARAEAPLISLLAAQGRRQLHV